MKENIIIIGPIGAGKTTISKKIAQSTRKEHISMDKMRKVLYTSLGYSKSEEIRASQENKQFGWYRYQKPFELESVKIILKKYRNAVIEFGGGQSVYHKEERIEEFLDLMEKEAFVFLVLPCKNVQESLQILENRRGQNKLNKIFVNSKTNRKVANYIIYTKGKKPKDTIEEIVKIYNNNCER